jgi:hypothetical protein
LRFLKRKEVTGERRRIHSEELYDLPSSPNIIPVIISRRRWARHVARMWDTRCAYKVLMSKHEGNIPLGRPRLRWEDNIKVDLQEVRW